MCVVNLINPTVRIKIAVATASGHLGHSECLDRLVFLESAAPQERPGRPGEQALLDLPGQPGQQGLPDPLVPLEVLQARPVQQELPA